MTCMQFSFYIKIDLLKQIKGYNFCCVGAIIKSTIAWSWKFLKRKNAPFKTQIVSKFLKKILSTNLPVEMKWNYVDRSQA